MSVPASRPRPSARCCEGRPCSAASSTGRPSVHCGRPAGHHGSSARPAGGSERHRRRHRRRRQGCDHVGRHRLPRPAGRPVLRAAGGPVLRRLGRGAVPAAAAVQGVPASHHARHGVLLPLQDGRAREPHDQRHRVDHRVRRRGRGHVPHQPAHRVGVAIVMVAVDWHLAVVVFGIILVVLDSFVFQRYASRAYRDVRETIGRVLGSLQEGITGVRVVQAFTQEGDQAGHLRPDQRGLLRRQHAGRQGHLVVLPRGRLSADRRHRVGVVLRWAAGARRRPHVRVAGRVPVLPRLVLPADHQPRPHLQPAAVGGRRPRPRCSGCSTPCRGAGAPDAVELGRGSSGAIEIEGVGFEYVAGSPVLADIEMSIAPGQRVAVVGETGAGKSTIAKLLLRFYDPTAGTVRVDGHDVRDLTFASRARAITPHSPGRVPVRRHAARQPPLCQARRRRPADPGGIHRDGHR